MTGLENSEVIFQYFIGTFGMVMLAGIIAFFFLSFQKKLLKKELEINRLKTQQHEEILNATIFCQEKEQKRIACDLHDEVGVMLSVVKLNLSLLVRNADDLKIKNLASETKEYLDEVILQVRNISR